MRDASVRARGESPPAVQVDISSVQLPSARAGNPRLVVPYASPRSPSVRARGESPSTLSSSPDDSNFRPRARGIPQPIMTQAQMDSLPSARAGNPLNHEEYPTSVLTSVRARGESPEMRLSLIVAQIFRPRARGIPYFGSPAHTGIDLRLAELLP